MTKTTFLRANRITRLSKRKGDVVVVGLLINGFALFAEHDISIIEIAQIVVRLYICQSDIAIFRVSRGKGDKTAVQCFQRTQVMRRKDQLPLPLFGNDMQKLAEQIS